VNYLHQRFYQPVLGKCVLGVQAGPQTIVVRQVVGENCVQKTIDLCVVVPKHKPAIGQIIDVFVKKLRITKVEVIPHKVIVCGEFEVKAIYVACLPNQPVHAVEVRRVRFTADVPIRGARCGMDAEARVNIEFVDYDCHHHHHRDKPAWPKYKPGHHQHHPHHQDCDDDCPDYDYHGHHGHHGDYDHGHNDDCHDDCHHQKPKPDNWCKPCWCPPEKDCFRRFNVTVVLEVVAKVMTDREIIIYPGAYPGLPPKPKG
jgi:hypothetical protein